MIALTDVDGVLLNWNYSFHRWMKKLGFTLAREDAYNLADAYAIGFNETVGLCERFNSSAEIGFLQPMEDAVYWIKRLHENHGYVFHAITSMGDDHYARKLRIMNLERLFGPNIFERIVILKCGEDKTEVLSEYKGSRLPWIEDHIHNANVGSDLGLQSYLITRPYNQDLSVPQNFTRVSGWKQLSSFIAPEHN